MDSSGATYVTEKGIIIDGKFTCQNFFWEFYSIAELIQDSG
jgi:hypothetical protein